MTDPLVKHIDIIVIWMNAFTLNPNYILLFKNNINICKWIRYLQL